MVRPNPKRQAQTASLDDLLLYRMSRRQAMG